MDDQEKRSTPRLLSANWVCRAMSLGEERGVRCAPVVGMPDRGLSHLRDGTHQRRGRLPARAPGAAGRGQCADLLLPTSGRHRHRSMIESFG